jgi:hypothetical protein
MTLTKAMANPHFSKPSAHQCKARIQRLMLAQTGKW